MVSMLLMSCTFCSEQDAAGCGTGRQTQGGTAEKCSSSPPLKNAFQLLLHCFSGILHDAECVNIFVQFLRLFKQNTTPSIYWWSPLNQELTGTKNKQCICFLKLYLFCFVFQDKNPPASMGYQISTFNTCRLRGALREGAHCCHILMPLQINEDRKRWAPFISRHIFAVVLRVFLSSPPHIHTKCAWGKLVSTANNCVLYCQLL